MRALTTGTAVVIAAVAAVALLVDRPLAAESTSSPNETPTAQGSSMDALQASLIQGTDSKPKTSGAAAPNKSAGKAAGKAAGTGKSKGTSKSKAKSKAPATSKPYRLEIPKGLAALTVPADNPLTAAKIALGKQLYFDKRLSRDNTVSCASCHDPAKGWSNGTPFATGIRGQVGGRNSPTIINSAYQTAQFWDGRATHLEGQALGPIQNPIEMDLTLDEVVAKLNKIAGYKQQFQAVFGSEVNSEGIAKAIASFERTVLSGDAPYDRFVAGDKAALSESAQRGMKVYFNKAQCSACHSGKNFTDGGFHNIGVGMDAKQPDLGRFAVTKMEGDKGAFKTPTLREIAKTGPYMHDGRLKTLREVIDFYDKGGIPNPQLDEEIFPLKLTAQEKADLEKFLTEGLSSPNYPTAEAPKLPE